MSAVGLLTGPSAKRYLSNAGTGLSDAGAAFLSAYCSPFSPPNEIVTGPPKVPDPRSRMETATTFLYANIEIPVSADGQIVIVNPNPLGPLPIAYGRSATPLTSAIEPIQWCEEYGDVGLGPLTSQLKNLADNSLQHRLVGCGLRVKITDPTTHHASRGKLEAGHFDLTNTRYTATAANISAGRALGADYSESGTFCTAWNSPTPGQIRQSLQGATTHVRGFSSNQDGVTVRWKDSKGFQFIPTIYENVIAPSKTYYSNGFEPFSPVGVYPSGGEAGTPQWDNATGTLFVVSSSAVRNTFYAMPSNNSAGAWQVDGSAAHTVSGTSHCVTAYQNTSTASGTGVNGYLGIGSQVGSGTLGVGSTAPVAIQRYGCFDQQKYPYIRGYEDKLHWTNPDHNFGDALYVDVTGVDVTQRLQVEVCWHIEYVPKQTALEYGQPSPVDMSYEMLQALGGDEATFPFVVAGDGFFTSLKRGIADAADGASRVLTRASDLSTMAPDARYLS